MSEIDGDRWLMTREEVLKIWRKADEAEKQFIFQFHCRTTALTKEESFVGFSLSSSMIHKALEAMMSRNFNPGEGWTWISICSRHQTYDENCDICQAGIWSNDEERAADSDLYKSDYASWYKKHNSE